MMKTLKKNGFTLLELMIVIADHGHRIGHRCPKVGRLPGRAEAERRGADGDVGFDDGTAEGGESEQPVQSYFYQQSRVHYSGR